MHGIRTSVHCTCERSMHFLLSPPVCLKLQEICDVFSSLAILGKAVCPDKVLFCQLMMELKGEVLFQGLMQLQCMDTCFLVLQLYFTLFVVTYSHITQILHFASILIAKGFCVIFIQTLFIHFHKLGHKIIVPQTNLNGSLTVT